MKEEKATIYDYARICKKHDNCKNCPLGLYNNGKGKSCDYLIRTSPDKANEIILKWIKEHPIKTRQNKFLEMFPNAILDDNGVLNVEPCDFDKDYSANDCSKFSCPDCRKKYWLEEVAK